MELHHVRESFAKRRMRHRLPIPIDQRSLNPKGRLPRSGRPLVCSWPLLVLAVLTLAACEDFEVTPHTVMDGPKPPDVVQIPERRLSHSEVIGHWKISHGRNWPNVLCALEVGSNGKFLWTSIDDLNCVIKAHEDGAFGDQGRHLQSVTGTWRVDGAVAEGTVSYFDMRRQETVEIAVGGHLRLVRPGTYCVVGIRIAHLDALIPEHPIPDPNDPFDERPRQRPDPDGRLKCFMIVQRIR